MSTTDIAVSTTLFATNFTSNSDIGLVLFADDPTFDFPNTGLYVADFKPNGSMRIQRVGGVATIVSTPLGTFTFDTSEMYTLTAEATRLRNINGTSLLFYPVKLNPL